MCVFQGHLLPTRARWKPVSILLPQGTEPGWWASDGYLFSTLLPPTALFLFVSAFFFSYPSSLLRFQVCGNPGLGEVSLSGGESALTEHLLCARPFTLLIAFKHPTAPLILSQMRKTRLREKLLVTQVESPGAEFGYGFAHCRARLPSAHCLILEGKMGKGIPASSIGSITSFTPGPLHILLLVCVICSLLCVWIILTQICYLKYLTSRVAER